VIRRTGEGLQRPDHRCRHLDVHGLVIAATSIWLVTRPSLDHEVET
jgi:hypothetical protein